VGLKRGQKKSEKGSSEQERLSLAPTGSHWLPLAKYEPPAVGTKYKWAAPMDADEEERRVSLCGAAGGSW